MTPIEEFRVEVRGWLEENCPESMRKPAKGLADQYNGGKNPKMSHPDQKIWCDRMADKGWIVPDWPVEYGGAGLDKENVRVLRQELGRIKAREPLTSGGIHTLAPALFKYGTEDQRLEHLPKMARGEVLWCQGFSEPGAGSDLASLSTKAEDAGDHFLVNGQKIWTSYAINADWIFALVRTEVSEKKHNGISLLLIDMTTEGVSVKPIVLISGSSPFCETFFDNVEVPKGNLVGEAGKAWPIAKIMLGGERAGLSAFGGSSGSKKTLAQKAVDEFGLDGAGKLDNTVLRHEIAQYQLDNYGFKLTMTRAFDEAKAGQPSVDSSAFLKYYGTELNKTRHELNLSVAGEPSVAWEGEQYQNGRIARAWLRSKANSIEGGTSEIQLNVIAKRILGLPDS